MEREIPIIEPICPNFNGEIQKVEKYRKTKAEDNCQNDEEPISCRVIADRFTESHLHN
jgi:hypothetical protein